MGDLAVTRRDVPTIRAFVWWCGDEVCDCCQPRIEKVIPRAVGFETVTLWEGTFISDPSSDERDAMDRELADECERRGLRPGLSVAGAA